MSHRRVAILFTILTTILTPLITYLLFTDCYQKHAVYTVFYIPFPHEITLCSVLMFIIQTGIWVAWMRILDDETRDDDMEEGKAGYESVVGNGGGLGGGVGLGIKETYGGDIYGYGYGVQGYEGGYREVMDGRGVRSG